MKTKIFTPVLLILCLIVSTPNHAQQEPKPNLHFSLDGNYQGSKTAKIKARGAMSFVSGLINHALEVNPAYESVVELPRLSWLNKSHDFTIQFWVRTQAEDTKRFKILSTKKIDDNSLTSQKVSGWTLYHSGGSLAWNIGDGKRRLNYERDNGYKMPLNDGIWHQITMTHHAEKAQIRLYYDGRNFAIYNLDDGEPFDFSTKTACQIGGSGNNHPYDTQVIEDIEQGAKQLQYLVNAFNSLGLGDVEEHQLETLVIAPQKLFDAKVADRMKLAGPDSTRLAEFVNTLSLENVSRYRSDLMKNPYTVHQAPTFMQVAPLLKIYSLQNGRITINESRAIEYGKKERFTAADFLLDELKIWNEVLTPQMIKKAYQAVNKTLQESSPVRKTSLTAAVWNIFHGGKHFTLSDDGWDSRMRIAEMISESGADVVMMQETYSSGDFIAAELGYYFATSVDWDYLNQGSNISVLSRYPIEEIHVPMGASFMDVSAKVRLSEDQYIYVMSNWYGMNQFENVYNFHKDRFEQANEINVLFGGDFNAVPHTDQGSSPASVKMLESGFTDAYRSLYPDVDSHPGITHRGGRRIDQLYYKGDGLVNESTRVISSWPTGFPSDHYLIITKFGLRK